MYLWSCWNCQVWVYYIAWEWFFFGNFHGLKCAHWAILRWITLSVAASAHRSGYVLQVHGRIDWNATSPDDQAIYHIRPGVRMIHTAMPLAILRAQVRHWEIIGSRCMEEEVLEFLLSTKFLSHVPKPYCALSITEIWKFSVWILRRAKYRYTWSREFWTH